MKVLVTPMAYMVKSDSITLSSSVGSIRFLHPQSSGKPGILSTQDCRVKGKAVEPVFSEGQELEVRKTLEICDTCWAVIYQSPTTRT